MPIDYHNNYHFELPFDLTISILSIPLTYVHAHMQWLVHTEAGVLIAGAGVLLATSCHWLQE